MLFAAGCGPNNLSFNGSGFFYVLIAGTALFLCGLVRRDLHRLVLNLAHRHIHAVKFNATFPTVIVGLDSLGTIRQ